MKSSIIDGFVIYTFLWNQVEIIGFARTFAVAAKFAKSKEEIVNVTACQILVVEVDGKEVVPMNTITGVDFVELQE